MIQDTQMTEQEFLDTLREARNIQEIIEGYGGIHALEEKINKVKTLIDSYGTVDELLETVNYLKERMFVFKDLFTLEDVAQFAGVSSKTIQRRIDEGQIKARKDKGIVIVERKEVLRWLRSFPIKELKEEESCHR